MIECKENEEVIEDIEEEYDYMHEESLEEDNTSSEDEEPDYCD